MEELASIESSYPEFFLAEMVQLENIYKDMGEKALDQEFCQELAISFSSSSIRAGKTPISWEQVHDWFQSKQKKSQAKVTSSADSMKLLELSETPRLSNGLKSSPDPRGGGVEDISELAFEARSAKDYAWYDVESFLTYRVVSNGELEVRVRYAGFSKAQDEWVNVKEEVRVRSIPLEASECHKVKVGDLVLCFLERQDYAVYTDARIIKVQRSIHDLRECRCIFVVRYDHDNSEEEVQWHRLCCRPTQEEPVPVVALNRVNPIESLWG